MKFNNFVKNHRIKFFGLWLLSITNKRFLAVHLDPVLACNFRCKMCYFTDGDYVKKSMKGIIKSADIEKIGSLLLKNALKLQIGCGAEPTLFKNNVDIVLEAKKHHVPYISMVTNGFLLTKTIINNLVNAGLNEFIISMHGVTKKSYENFMEKGQYDVFREVLQQISDQKQTHPKLKLRINYTFNEDNFQELDQFFTLFGHYKLDIIQLRPIDKIGESTYSNFSLKKIENIYPAIATFMHRESARRHITLLCPKTIVRDENVSLKVQSQNDSSYLMPFTYCYVSPNFWWKQDFDRQKDTFSQWKKRTKWNKTLFKNIFLSRAKLEQINRNMLNYDIV